MPDDQPLDRLINELFRDAQVAARLRTRVMPQQGNCNGCGAAILWVRTAATNSLMPLDAEPNPKGNVVIKDGLAHTLNGSLFEPMLDGERYMPHHATCPHAAKYRKKK